MKVKATRTMYFDYYCEEVTDIKPQGKYKDDYDIIRKGHLFDVYTDPTKLEDIGITCYPIIVMDKYGTWFGFDSLKELYECNYLVVKDN